LWRSLRERDHLEDLGIDGRKMDLQEVVWEHGTDWSARDRDRWRALMNVVMNLWVP